MDSGSSGLTCYSGMKIALALARGHPMERSPADPSTDRGTPGTLPVVPEERHFRAVADFTADWESWHGPGGRLIWVNPAVERMTGYSVAECHAMPDYPLSIVAPEDRSEIRGILEAASGRTSGSNVEFRGRLRGGGIRWLSLSWQPMPESDGTWLGFRTSVRDVTERRQLRDQLRLHAEHLEQLVQERTERLRQLELRQRQMEKLVALGQLAAGVAHEINNPLAGMRNAFELIRSSTAPDHEHYELLELIDREIERISSITHQMYQLYSRPGTRPAPSPAEFSLGRVVSEVLTILDGTARRGEVVIGFDGEKTGPPVTLVEGEVKQILYNLVRNAIQATPPRGTVLVRVIEGHREVTVEVRDSGPGIAPEVLPRIFEPFFSTKGGEGGQSGMGMGLSVSRSLIDAMGGRIEVAAAPGRGSLFAAVFPIRLEPLEEPSP